MWLNKRRSLLLVDESVDERPILRSPEYKILKDITVDKNLAKSVKSKQPYNVVTTKVQATFREQSFNSNSNISTKHNSEKQNVKKLFRKAPSHGHSAVQCDTPTIPFMSGVSSGSSQYPLHMSQVFHWLFSNGFSCKNRGSIWQFLEIHLFLQS